MLRHVDRERRRSRPRHVAVQPSRAVDWDADIACRSARQCPRSVIPVAVCERRRADVTGLIAGTAPIAQRVEERTSTHGGAKSPRPRDSQLTYAERMHVVVVDDEQRMVELIARYLADQRVGTTGCFDGPSGLIAARGLGVDAVVLDLMLPGLSGIEVCKQLRREGNDVPILMLTARGAVPERVAGLEAGADDYLVKPFALEELHARLRAIRRRLDPDADHRLVVGDITLDPLEQRVWVAGTEVTLSRREFAMLTSLMESRGHVVSRARLYDDVWDGEVDINSNALDVHMSRLRNQLAASDLVTIRTLRGVGYRMETSKEMTHG